MESVGFKFEGEHEIDPKNDYPIFEEYYDQFFELQNVNGNLRLKNPRGKTFWDIFEEYELPVEGETEEQRQTSKLEELESEISLLKQLIQGKRE